MREGGVEGKYDALFEVVYRCCDVDLLIGDRVNGRSLLERLSFFRGQSVRQ